jgi:hypothetical protein
MALDGHGRVVVTGRSESDIATVAYDVATGAQLWAARYPSDANGRAALTVDPAGYVYVVGTTTIGHFLTLKYSPLGEELWAAAFDAGGSANGYAVTTDGFGHVFVTGTASSILDFTCLTVEYDALGRTRWAAIYDAGLNDRAYSVAVDDAGHVYVAGSTERAGTGWDFLTIKYDTDAYAKGDFDADRHSDLVLSRPETGELALWTMNGTERVSTVTLPSAGPNQRVAGVDDFDGDGDSDLLLWDRATRALELWSMNGTTREAVVPLAIRRLSSAWEPVATGDFDWDGKPDLVWRNRDSQQLRIWTLNGLQRTGTITPTPAQAVDANWELVAARDYDGDGHTDLLWYNVSSGKTVQWLMDANVQRVSGRFTTPASAGDNNWRPVASADYGVGPNGVVGSNDLVWRNSTSGRYVVWYLDYEGRRTAGTFTNPPEPDSNPTAWTVAGPK